MNARAITISSGRTKAVIFATMMAIAIAAPYLGNQFITGPIVNATLIIAAATLGLREAMLIAVFPSITALATGLLPVPMAPQVPFIIGGNVALIAVFSWLKNKNYWLGVVSGALVKFGFLFGTSATIVASLLANETLAAKVTYMMSWPQLVTALAGGIIAWGFLWFVKPADNA